MLQNNMQNKTAGSKIHADKKEGSKGDNIPPGTVNNGTPSAIINTVLLTTGKVFIKNIFSQNVKNVKNGNHIFYNI